MTKREAIKSFVDYMKTTILQTLRIMMTDALGIPLSIERTMRRMAMWSLVFGSAKEIMQKCVYIITLLEQKSVNTVTIEKDFFSF